MKGRHPVIAVVWTVHNSHRTYSTIYSSNYLSADEKLKRNLQCRQSKQCLMNFVVVLKFRERISESPDHVIMQI